MTLAFALAFVLPAQAQADEQLELGAIATQDASDTTTLGVQVKYGQSEARSMLDLVNQFRGGEITDGGQSTVWAYASNGSVDTASYQNLGSLTYDYELEKVAMQRAAEIALQYSHARPNGLDCFSAFPDGYSTKGENIAAGYGEGSSTTAQGAFESWCETNYSYSGQGHRRNMLGSGYNRIGIGHVVVHWSGTLTEGTRPYSYSVDIHYWVQEFGYRDDSVGLAATAAQDDTTAHPVDVAVSNSNIQSVALTANVSSFTLGHGDTTTFDGVSCGVWACDPSNSGNHTWPDEFNLEWGDGAISKGSYSVPVDAPYSLQSSDESVVTVSGHEVTGVSVGSANLVASTDLASGAETTVPVTVTSKTLSSAIVTLSDETYTYDGTAKQPEVMVSVNAVELDENTDYTVAYKNNVNAGIATVIVAGKGSYAGSAQATFTIERAKITVKADNKSKTYGEDDPVLTATVEGCFGNDADGIAYEPNRVAGEDVREDGYEIQVHGPSVQGNYDVSFENGVLFVSPRPINVVVTGNSASVVYDGTEHAIAGYTISGLDDTGLSESDIVPVEGLAAEAKGTNAGSYAMGLNESSFSASENVSRNYDVSFAVVDGCLTIAKAPSSVSIAEQSKTYNAKAQAYSGKATKSGSSGTVTYAYYSDAACTRAATPKAAGTYYVRATVAADDNYASATGAAVKFTINKAANPMVFKAQTKTVKYAKLKKAKQVVSIKASKAQGAVIYKKVKVNKKKASFSVGKTTGKITVKKGTPKGTYKVTVQAYAKGNPNHAPSKKVKRIITIKVK